MVRATLVACVLVLGCSWIAPAYSADGSPQKRKVVMQVNDADEKIWNHALTLAENMQANSGGKDNIDIQIVAMSPGIRMVASDSPVASRVTKATENGIAIRACGYTMTAVRWGPEKLAAGVKPVPFGALELIDKQREGWAYIKP